MNLNEMIDILHGDFKMNLNEMIDILHGDLKNELTHMHFYLQSAALVQGLHAKEYKEHFFAEANKEMKHVSEFSDLLIGLGGESKITTEPYLEKLPKLKNPVDIAKHALKIEEEVVSNYCLRIKQAESLNSVDGTWIQIFMEKQVENSRIDIDELKQIIRGIEAGY
jgi:bacterioferritin (cytochrome b1)